MRLTIERLGHQGDGVAEGPVFVPRTLPGEVVEGEVTAGRMEAPAIVTPSADRRRAPCPHYAACGGCALQHATDGFVAGWKAQVVATAAHHLPPTVPSRRHHTTGYPARRIPRSTAAGPVRACAQCAAKHRQDRPVNPAAPAPRQEP